MSVIPKVKLTGKDYERVRVGREEGQQERQLSQSFGRARRREMKDKWRFVI